MVKNISIDAIALDGGLLCLDFINSVTNRRATPLQDYLLSLPDLISWAIKLKIIDASTAKLLCNEALRQPKKAEAFFEGAINFRELLYRIFWSISAGKKVPEASMKTYNALLAVYFPYLQIKQTSKGFTENWQLEESNFKRLLAPIINDSYEVLLSSKLIRIKECSNCGWLFYDSTKNGKRRWCSMKSCGSSVKALEWYYRHKN